MTRNVFKLIGIASLVAAIGLSAIGCVINPDDGPRVVQITVTGIPAEHGGKTFKMKLLHGDDDLVGAPSEVSVPQGGGTVTFTITDDEAMVGPYPYIQYYLYIYADEKPVALIIKNGLNAGANTIPWSEFSVGN